MTSIFAFIFVLGVLIFVHELGHFMMARRIGVRVLTFSLGFGPKLLSFRRGDTEYCVSAIPLGGYVKMAGENPEDTRTGASDEFLSKSKWQRFQVLVMGPVMNLALAVIVMAAVLYQGSPVQAWIDRPPVVGGFEREDAVAKAAGVLPGDRILAVNGTRVATWEDLELEIIGKAKRQITLLVERNGRPLEIDMVPAAETKYEAGTIGVRAAWRPQILAVSPNSPASEAGLREGDVILAVGGERGILYARVLELIRSHENKPLEFEIERNGQTVTATVTPRMSDGLPRIGAGINEYEVRFIRPGALQAVTLSLEQNWKWAKLIVKTLAGLFTRETSVKQLMGPVAIADLSGTAAQSDSWIPLFSLMAMISLNLGLLNLMPIPVLDGGHIAILALEGLSRRDFSMKVKEKMLLAGFVLLLMLMVTVIYNDLTRVQWIERLMPWR